MGFLSEIAERTRASLAERPLDRRALERLAAAAPEARDIVAALRRSARDQGIAVIAEVKRASPSAGPIAADADPAGRARAYAGAAAISVLTEPEHFGGSLQDLEAVREAVEVPVLRKDFLVHASQVVESRASGADSVLLIAACLPGSELGEMIVAARDLGMEPLVEAHTDDDLERALDAGAGIVGVNSRDLETLQVDVDAALDRVAKVPGDRIAVLESGVSTPDQVRRAIEAGASAVLVGEALMRAQDPSELLRDLIAAGGGR